MGLNSPYSYGSNTIPEADNIYLGKINCGQFVIKDKTLYYGPNWSSVNTVAADMTIVGGDQNGIIQMNSAGTSPYLAVGTQTAIAMTTGTTTYFTLTNSAILATSFVQVGVQKYSGVAAAKIPRVFVAGQATGSVTIGITNGGSGTLGEVLSIWFNIM